MKAVDVQSTNANLNHSRNIAILMAVILFCGLTTAVIMYSFDRHSLVYYGDSVSHLVSARKFFDWSENPGWAQLGTVWLPLPHFLLMFPSMVDYLFFTGFAGLAISLPSLALTAVFIYKIIVRILSTYLETNRWIIQYSAFACALLYSLNPNFLYLGITAMTEAPFMLFFVGSAYYLLKWYELASAGIAKRQALYVLFSSLFATAATLCRYEGWFLPVFIIAIVTILTLKFRHKTMVRGSLPDKADNLANTGYARSEKFQTKAALATLILASVVSASGIGFWLLYNKITYGNAFEFANAQYYSAAAQALNRPNREALFLQPLNDINVYGTTMFMVFGPVILVAAACGYFLYLKRRSPVPKTNRPQQKMLPFSLWYVILPPVFTIVSLLVGIGEMSLWFNARFVVLIAPLLLVLVGVYLAWQPQRILRSKPLLIGVTTSLFVFQSGVPAFGAVVTLADATAGFNTGQTAYAAAAGEKIGQLYDGKGLIMVITGSAQEHRIMISSNLPLHNFDDITQFSSWKKSFYDPWNTNDRFIILSKDPDSDTVSVVKYWSDHRQLLDEHYHQVFENKYYEILVQN